MRIRGNWASLLSWRALTGANGRLESHLGRLSSGLRINSAADDAAGLAIANRLKGQFQGLMRANRNAMDGVSLVNTAEGALQEVHTLLQRGRQLSLQAATGTLTVSDRQMVQDEMVHILAEIDHIADTVTYNGQKLLRAQGSGAGMASVIEGLRSGWLEKSEALIASHYGITGDGSNLRFQFEYGGAQPTWISGDPNGLDGKLDNLTIHINVASFGTDGGTGPFFNDRSVARALTQAVLARNSDYANLEKWFSSGVADYIAGRDELLKQDVATFGTGAVVNAIDNWSEDSSMHQSSAYLAVKYLDSLLPPFTLANVMQELSWGNDLDSALLNTVGLDSASFVTDFKLNGVAFLGSLDLDDSDVGAIGGGDASGVVPDGGTYSMDPLVDFSVIWPETSSAEPVVLHLQVGADAHQTLRVLIPEVSTWSLGLVGIDLTSRAGQAAPLFDAAIDQVSQARSHLGSTSNRLEHILRSNDESTEAQLGGYSRIVDLDVAHEMTQLTRNQVLVSSASAMLAQSNLVRQHVMWLLKDLTVPGVG